MGLTEDQKRGYERTIIPGFQEDLTLIENVTIENIEKVLKGRFMNDNIYTAVGPLLFSVNPYRTIIKDEHSIYSEDIARLYFNSSSLELAPHIFMTAADCYKDLRRTGQNQAVIVTGESGSGKTEASKHIITFITFVCVDHIEFLNSMKQKSFAAAEEEAQQHHQQTKKRIQPLEGVKEGDEDMYSEEEVDPFTMEDMLDELSVQDQVNQTFESHTTLPQRSTVRRSRVHGGGTLTRPPPPPPPGGPGRSARSDGDSMTALCGSMVTLHGASGGDLSALRDAAQNEADLREIFDSICDDDELLHILQLKSFNQIEEAVESNVVSEDFIDLLVVKFNENAEDEDEKDKISFIQFKQVLKLIEEEISRKEKKRLTLEQRISGRPILASQYSGAFDYTEASLDVAPDEDYNSFNDDGNVVNPLQLRSMHDIRAQLLESITILEAFGNSQTMRNDNSSRFAKYVELQFDEKLARLVGGKISTFLLERSRLVHQISDEYNFHILSYLTRGSNEQNRERFLLEEPDQYKYLMYDAHHRESAENPAFTFELVRKAMLTAGFPQENMDEIFALLSAILSLGNLEFEDNGNDLLTSTVLVSNQRTLDVCASLMEIKPSALNDALVSHKLYQGNKSDSDASSTDASSIRQRRITCAVKNHDVNYATISRDSLAKELYSRLFKYIVTKLNEKIDCTGFSGKSIGVLDICGFEIFQTNRFEQFCINWANEKLHLFFIEQTLRAEKREYENEGINSTYSDTILDNEKVVSTIEGKGGLIALLDDQILLNDFNPDNFITNVDCLFASNKDVVIPNVYKDQEKQSNAKVYTFGIHHYAGTVTYNAHQFIEKNSDTLYDDLMKVMRSSKSPFIVELCAPTKTDNEKTHSKKPPTVGSQFRTHLQGLVTLLQPCNPRYVCCLKPNDNKNPEDVDSTLIKRQIEYLGMTKHIAIRQEGYCFRSTFEDFLQRYRVLSTATWPHWDIEGNPVEFCRAILLQSSNASFNGFILRGRRLKEEQDFVFGRTKVFIKDYKAINSLEKMRSQAMVALVARVQGTFRMRVVYKDYRKTLKAVLKIQTRMRTRLARTALSDRVQSIIFLQKCLRSWVLRKRYQKLNTKVFGKLPRDHVRMLQAKTRGLLCRNSLRRDSPDVFAQCLKVKNRITDLLVMGELEREEGVVMLRCKLEGAIHSMALTPFFVIDNSVHWNVGVVGKNKVGIPLDPTSKIVKGGQSFKPQSKQMSTGASTLSSNPFMQGQKKKTALPPGSSPAPSEAELNATAISLGNAVGTSEVVIVCVNEKHRDKLFAALSNTAQRNTQGTGKK